MKYHYSQNGRSKYGLGCETMKLSYIPDTNVNMYNHFGKKSSVYTGVEYAYLL